MKEGMMTITVCYKKKEQAKLEDKILNIFQSKYRINGYFNYRIFLYWPMTELEKAVSLNNSYVILGTVIWLQIRSHTCQ